MARPSEAPRLERGTIKDHPYPTVSVPSAALVFAEERGEKELKEEKVLELHVA